MNIQAAIAFLKAWPMVSPAVYFAAGEQGEVFIMEQGLEWQL